MVSLVTEEAFDEVRGCAEVKPVEASFRDVFDTHLPYVWRLLRYLGVSDADLEDACQDVFVIAHRRMGELQQSDVPRPWMRQICVNVASNSRRSQRRRRYGGGLDDLELPTEANQHREAEVRQMRQVLLSVLEQVPEDQRRVFVLYEIEQLSMSEVASTLECPLQTAYHRLHAARAKATVLARAAWEGDLP